MPKYGKMDPIAKYGKMDPIAKAALCAALRSGNYPQGSGYLRSDEGKYCCLGVLCALGALAEARWEPDREVAAIVYAGKRSDGRASAGWPPDDVQISAGLSMAAMDHLAEMNDSDEPFPNIADWIEKTL